MKEKEQNVAWPMERERSLVNARENWLLNLAAGMSAAHPGLWVVTSAHCHLLTLSLRSIESPSRYRGNEKLLRGQERSTRRERAKWKAIVDDVEAYGLHPTKIREATLWNGLP